MKKLLVSGSAGFVGYHLVKALVEEKFNIIGIDNLNDYYDVNLKIARLERLQDYQNFKFEKIDLVDKEKLFQLFEKEKFDYVINLAAQAGVRYSIENPYAYLDSNIIGFLNLLEACRKYPIDHLIYASSSSVYGSNLKQPFSESDNVDHPVSLYAATKKSNELMAHTYSNLYNIPTTGLRFFTVYGPWGRPDMAYFSFTRNIFENRLIKVFNNGNLERDFTYIQDIIEGIKKLIQTPPKENPDWDRVIADPATSNAPYQIFNIGNNKPIKLLDFINILEKEIGIEAKKEFLPMQQGDVYSTYADISSLNNYCGFNPITSIEEGLKNFVSWYKEFYKK
ncbi:MAG: NAD-dependent epimerase [Ignavibacteriae bacterium]|nr:NAD-dependent epimerase [Ignavibacteriota bacterium]MCB9207952.1 NAD-dependent epimerase [Ignavibacteriales bacterium]MCB9258721.1 NAD-dependent epimerase [Ignavibacteriales bacterium]